MSDGIRAFDRYIWELKEEKRKWKNINALDGENSNRNLKIKILRAQIEAVKEAKRRVRGACIWM